MEQVLEQPFNIGDKVFKWKSEYVKGSKVLSPRLYIVVGIKKAWPRLSQSGWVVDCESRECPHCGNPASRIEGYDSSWFVKASE